MECLLLAERGNYFPSSLLYVFSRYGIPLDRNARKSFMMNIHCLHIVLGTSQEHFYNIIRLDAFLLCWKFEKIKSHAFKAKHSIKWNESDEVLWRNIICLLMVGSVFIQDGVMRNYKHDR